MNIFKLSAISLLLCAGAAQAAGLGPSTSGGTRSSPTATGTAPATGGLGTNTTTSVGGTETPVVNGTTLPTANGAQPGTTTPLQPGTTPGSATTSNNNLFTRPATTGTLSTPAATINTNASGSFNGLDANGDGRLTAAEAGMDSTSNEFKQRDANHDGVLTSLEFGLVPSR